jgi:hypothetical protein
MMRIGSVAVALVIASGCALTPEATPEGDDDFETSSAEQAVTVLPIAGRWIYDEIPPITTNCPTLAPRAVSGPFTIQHLSATSYRVTPADGLPAFTCTVVDNTFNCPNRATIRVPIFGLFATLTYTISVTGIHTTNRAGTGKQDVGVTCSGFHCPVLDDVPCGYVHNFNTRAQ